MSTSDKAIHLSPEIVTFYQDQLRQHGDSSQGVGWKNDQAQVIRFIQLARVIGARENFSVNDLGCGTGKFFSFLVREQYQPAAYRGYDMLQEMIEASREAIGSDPRVHLVKGARMEAADYSVASGIFNVRYEANEAEWLAYVLATLEHMHDKSTSGFSFNMLTRYSDADRMQRYLYYADPSFFFDYCKRNFSRNVALLHDYDQYDFTIIVRKIV